MNKTELIANVAEMSEITKKDACLAMHFGIHSPN